MTAKITLINGKKKCSSDKCLNLNKDENGLMPVSEFSVAKDKVSGYSSLCKKCHKANRLSKNLENPELRKLRYLRNKELAPFRKKILVKFKKCSKKKCANPDKLEDGTLPISEFVKDASRKTNLSCYCKQCMRADWKKYRQGNLEKVREHGLAYSRAHLVEKRKYSKRYSLRFPEKRRVSRLKWKKENPAYFSTYIKNRKTVDVNFKLTVNLRKRLNTALRLCLDDKRVSAVSDLGCTIPEFVKYIESLWLPGMSWENYGKGKDRWNIDHIVALANFNLADPAQQKKAVHYTNQQPLWEPDNLSKSAKVDWKKG